MAFRSALDNEKEDETNYLLDKAKGLWGDPLRQVAKIVNER